MLGRDRRSRRDREMRAQRRGLRDPLVVAEAVTRRVFHGAPEREAQDRIALWGDVGQAARDLTTRIVLARMIAARERETSEEGRLAVESFVALLHEAIKGHEDRMAARSGGDARITAPLLTAALGGVALSVGALIIDASVDLAPVLDAINAAMAEAGGDERPETALASPDPGVEGTEVRLADDAEPKLGAFQETDGGGVMALYAFVAPALLLVTGLLMAVRVRANAMILRDERDLRDLRELVRMMGQYREAASGPAGAGGGGAANPAA